MHPGTFSFPSHLLLLKPTFCKTYSINKQIAIMYNYLLNPNKFTIHVSKLVTNLVPLLYSNLLI